MHFSLWDVRCEKLLETLLIFLKKSCTVHIFCVSYWVSELFPFRYLFQFCTFSIFTTTMFYEQNSPCTLGLSCYTLLLKPLPPPPQIWSWGFGVPLHWAGGGKVWRRDLHGKGEMSKVTLHLFIKSISCLHHYSLGSTPLYIDLIPG